MAHPPHLFTCHHSGSHSIANAQLCYAQDDSIQETYPSFHKDYIAIEFRIKFHNQKIINQSPAKPCPTLWPLCTLIRRRHLAPRHLNDTHKRVRIRSHCSFVVHTYRVLAYAWPPPPCLRCRMMMMMTVKHDAAALCCIAFK